MTHSSRIVAAAAVACLAAGLVAGCHPAGRNASEEARLVEAASRPRELVVFRADGSRAAWSDVIAAAAAADAVLVGEIHSQPVGQAFQAAFFADVLAAAPRAGAALEFFERDQQAALDDYLRGLSSESQFREATGRKDSSYPPGHRALIEACKAARRPAIAANAPRRYVTLARTQGYETLAKLSDEQRRLFRIPDALPTGRYYDNFVKLMSGMSAGHGDPANGGSKPAKAVDATPADSEAAAKAATHRRERIEAAFRSQSLWDWSMAESVARVIGDDPDRQARPMVLIIGDFHVAEEGGTVLALRALRPGAKIVTLSSVPQWSTVLREQDQGRADFVMYVGPSPDGDE